MSLKGYQRVNLLTGKTIMSFEFKYDELDVWQDVEEKDFNEFIKYIQENDFSIHKINLHGNKIIY